MKPNEYTSHLREIIERLHIDSMPEDEGKFLLIIPLMSDDALNFVDKHEDMFKPEFHQLCVTEITERALTHR